MREGAGPKISRSAKITQATAVHGPGTLEQQVNGERRHLRQVRYRGRCVHSCSSGGCLMTPDSHNSDPPSHSGRPRAPQQPMPLHQVRRCIPGAHLCTRHGEAVVAATGRRNCDWWIPQTATTTQDSLVQVFIAHGVPMTTAKQRTLAQVYLGSGSVGSGSCTVAPWCWAGEHGLPRICPLCAFLG